MLTVLGLTRRPLRIGELAGALGLPKGEGTRVCRWLTKHGYIVTVSDSSEEPVACTLASKGREWSVCGDLLEIPDMPATRR